MNQAITTVKEKAPALSSSVQAALPSASSLTARLPSDVPTTLREAKQAVSSVSANTEGPTRAIALARLKANVPAFIALYLVLHADLYRWLSRDVVPTLLRNSVGIHRESTRSGIWWLERLPYIILLVNILGASRRLLNPESAPVVQPSAGAVDISLYKTTKTSAVSNRGYVPSPEGKDRPGLPRPATPSSLRPRRTADQQSGTDSKRDDQRQVGQIASSSTAGPSSQAMQTPARSGASGSPTRHGEQPTPVAQQSTQPPSPTINEMLAASADKHRERALRLKASSRFLSSSGLGPPSPLARLSILGASVSGTSPNGSAERARNWFVEEDPGLDGSPAMRQSIMSGR